MEYIYGTTERGGVMVENLKTVGEAHHGPVRVRGHCPRLRGRDHH